MDLLNIFIASSIGSFAGTCLFLILATLLKQRMERKSMDSLIEIMKKAKADYDKAKFYEDNGEDEPRH